MNQNYKAVKYNKAETKQETMMSTSYEFEKLTIIYFSSPSHAYIIS